MDNVEHLVLSNLIFNEEYGRKVIPFLRTDYFSELSNKVTYELTNAYIQKYNAFPTIAALSIDLQKSTGLNEEDFKRTTKLISSFKPDALTNLGFLLDTTEKWCQDRALYIAIMKSISIMEDKKAAKGSIPQILTDALAVSFDTNIGHDYLEDSDGRFDFYHRREKKLPFDIDFLNKITGGGITNKTLTIILAGINVGKSAFMCHCAASHLLQGHNVLYITLEMAEEKIAERIDANLLDITISDLKHLSKPLFEERINKLKSKIKKGKFIIKEYPTACAGVSHFRHLLNELKIKKNFKPDVIYIDYINLCISGRFNKDNGGGLYGYVKSIAEELRGLAVEQNVPIVSATQLTRSGFTSSDVGMEDTAESFGLPATADLMIALLKTDELMDLNQIMVKQLKNRYGNPNINRRFVIGFDADKMKFYDVEQSAQDEIVDENKRKKRTQKIDKSTFRDFK